MLFFAPVTFAQTPKADKNNPLGGEQWGKYFGEQNERKVEITVELRNATGDDGLEINSQINNCALNVTKVDVSSGTTPTLNTKTNSAPITSDDATKSLRLNFTVAISPNNNVVNGSIYYLPKNWSKFDYKVSCSISGGTPASRNGSYEKPANAVRTKLAVQLKKPIVHQNSNDKIIIPMFSGKTVKVKVRMLLGTSESAAGEGVLTGGQWSKISLRAASPIAFNNDYIIELSLPDFDDELISPDISNTDTVFSKISGNTGHWQSGWTNPFTFEAPTISSLTNLRISSSTAEKSLPITTTADVRVLKIKLGNNFVSSECNKENESSRVCVFNLSKTEIPEGESRISFEGESSEGVPFTNPAGLSITKTAKPTIDGVPVFQVKDNNFTMTYKFRGDVGSVTASLAYENTSKQNKDAWTQTSTCGSADANGVKTCVFTLGTSGLNLSNLTEEDKKSPDIPVKFQIDAVDGNGTRVENLDSLTFRLVNKDHLAKSLREIEADYKKPNSNTTLIIESIAQLLLGDRTKTTDETVQATFSAFKDGSGKDKYKVLFGILKSVGNIALTAFGIPIKF